MAKYKKRADGRYATSILIGYQDNGKPKLKTLYGRTIRELEDKTAEFRALQNKGIIIDDKSMTVGQWAEKWLELFKRSKSYNTYEMYRSCIHTHIVPQIGAVRLNALKKHMIQTMLNEVVESGSQRTAEIIRLTMKQLISAAIDEQYIYADVSRGLTLPERTRKEKRALTDEEIKKIQTADLTLRERTLIELLLYAGLRRGEALGLSPKDIDFKRNTISISKTVIFKGNTPEIKDTPKSDSGIREIPIPSNLKATLQEYLQSRIGESYLLTMERRNSLITKSSFRKLWDNIIKKTGLDKDVTAHILRHTYSTKLFYGGIDAKTAQYLLGHSSISMTLDIYTHLQKDNTEIRTKLNDVFSM